MVLTFMLWRKSSMAMPSAAPSVGSVPEPSSSNRHRQSGSASLRICTVLVMWDEKVERLCSMLCSSPMSANTFLYIPAKEPSAAGI